MLAHLADGWEDAAGRSIYGVVAAEVKKDPVVLGLSDLTGQRATAGAVVTVCNENMAKMDLKARQSAALCTDNPTTMITARRLWVETYTWMIVYACFLHMLNTLIGKITAFPAMRTVTQKNTHIVSFFNRSHYWGGQLAEIASGFGIRRGLTINTESRWYALILMCLSVQTYQKSLHTLCERPDAQKPRNGLSAIPTDIIQLVTQDLNHWDLTDQLLRICKPLVDAIGNLESRDATLADLQPVLTSSFSSNSLEDITPEDISMAELDEAFDSVAAALTDFREGVDMMTGLVVKDRFDGTVDAAAVFDLSELDKILQGDTPIFVAEDHQVHHWMDGSAEIWDVDSLKAQAGLF
ncbi:hypothetical protein EW145_g5898 [Phellinidium pouzarii]|uniref:DUF659 domain-containing protein n=1 Tax=Phellinidium pouzarii TaxID=167371 RepID=A0A4S4KYH8_9AGAM|nr:hypothetical protein EW145_g5898 [Phellinidium pouzarii]